MGEKNPYKIFVGIPVQREPLGDPNVEARIVLKWILISV
jgi:hypothetical protein